MSPDAIDYLNSEVLKGLNLYAYCENDPVNKYDPSGHLGLLVLGELLIAGSYAIGFGASAINQGFTYGWDEINYWQCATDGLFAATSIALSFTGIGMVYCINSFGNLFISS